MSASARRRRRTNSNNSESEPLVSSSSSRVMQQSQDSAAAVPVLPPPGVLSSGPGSTGCKDRSQEFKTIVKTLQSSLQYNNTNGVNHKGARPKTIVRNEFNTVAKRISKDLANTFSKLEKLTLLAKRKSLFDDRGAETERLTDIIRQDLTSLNTQISHLQTLSKTSQRHTSLHEKTHSNTVVVSLQSKLAGMSGNFKSVLEVRTENLKHQKSRREEFSLAARTTPSDPTDAISRAFGSVLLQDEASFNSKSGQTVVNMDGVMPVRQQQQQQLQLIDEQDSYIQGRADTMANIEQTIVELGGIFQQLATMVHEQEELVQRIDSNVDEAHMNIESAHGELVKYFQSVSSNRWLMLKIFGVLIIFFIIFIVFLA